MRLKPLTFSLAIVMVSAAILPSSAAAAGPPPQPNAAQIQLALRKLGVVGSVLYVAAHPDDENTTLLAYLANELLLRTAYLSITRGDGGQNLVGPEQGAELGVIRTQELLAARRVDGAEQFFTRARDFGYSKSPDETLRLWGKDAVLADVVGVIRRFRPDVIITRFSPEPSDTHGHHTASAMLAVEAFHAAADPTFHPEQVRAGFAPWQARRLLWNRSSWSIKPGDDLSGFLSLDAGGYNPLLGVSYGEMAADSRSNHKSQGFGMARARGPALEYFRVLANEPPSAPGPSKSGGIFEGLDFSWRRFPGTADLAARISAAQAAYQPATPSASVPALLEIDSALDAVRDAGWQAQKRREVRDLVLAAAGVFLDATASTDRAAPGAEVELTATAVSRSGAAVVLRQVGFPTGIWATVQRPLVSLREGGAATPVDIKQTIKLPANASLTTPYWLAAPGSPGLFRVDDVARVGLPEAEPPLKVDFVLSIGERTFSVTRPVAYKWTDPVAGERYRPFEIVPLVSVRPETSVLVLPRGAGAHALSVELEAGAPGQSGAVRAEPPPGWSVEPKSVPFSLPEKGARASVVFQLRATRGGAAPTAPGVLRVVAEAGNSRQSRGVVRIEHPHIPPQSLLAPAEVRLVPVALHTAGKRLGYIPGPGDEVAAALRQVGYDVTLLDDKALAAGPRAWQRFDALVVGVRAFNTNPRLLAARLALMDYVQSGGTLVVQYNTNNRLSPLEAPLGPFPFQIGRDRITDETAAVTFTAPTHPVLTTPNRLGPADFEGWVQERGLYFAESWDPRYQTVLSMNDPGEPARAGSLLLARHGKGTFVYTGLAFFRQLPAGVPGAFRLFANLLAGGAPPRE